MGYSLQVVDFALSLLPGISLLPAKEQLGLSKKEKLIFWSHVSGKDRLDNELFSSCIEQGASVTGRKQYRLNHSLFPRLAEAMKGQTSWEVSGQNYLQLPNLRSSASKLW